ncbi:MAG: sigma-70 region 4 domain-containing protein [Kiloniellales bacterium]|nr:sigma-70 region 4 domain-containing protein [Kiloniellales bacterium]
MTGAVYDTAVQAWAPSFCCLQGVVARRRKERAQDNPYPKGSPEARCWQYGYETMTRRTRAAASREAVSSGFPGPGRGRSVRGLRGDWSQEDLALLNFAAEDLPYSVIGDMLGRSVQAVKNRLHRLDKPGV